jgi:hypothetical protein
MPGDKLRFVATVPGYSIAVGIVKWRDRVIIAMQNGDIYELLYDEASDRYDTMQINNPGASRL